MPEGRIVKALSGFYYVADGDRVFSCRARGLFKKKGAKVNPLVGDWVVYDAINEEEGYVMEVGERTSELVRPPISNVDQAVLVFSMFKPAFSALLLDKFLVHTEHAGIDSIIILSKADQVPEEEVRAITEKYEAIGYTVIPTSTKQETRGLQEVREVLHDRISVFAGQSGVGKSSLINALFPGVSLQTGDVSEKLGRGKHTTRHVELIPLEGGGYVADTPGFSSLEFMDLDELDLAEAFRDFAERSPDCKFRGCLHVTEPSCAVQEGVASGELSKERYENYLQFREELKEYQRRNKPW
ncbi:ribosome small subunit-dependent GTPase A [Brevibacillus centrosporus]|jgi:ribosome biogenesis GTPase|uniref:Small ribosomal subunit biogenesis GTPase RsgA n=1 Tax=Brevibacillus centrosporus TaxID=54910 RepID=A0A1I3T7Z7_9BACL|nr:ribosome small subunit-dependent GTPase A [Brevibacillus centrosporus]MEC2128286.1 ribosome small subunit-dependent GTPase A [Brevibacillus centrosporus]MED1953924.1 ribosome small subunit-dependent GTPase A [Brevibacillus centrosporus]MED4909708.1 ribosome small subunit-dependent GTPase A [Brevibacillus centrosporus]RNB73861.1 ribosome small subunit-dependent GTPase A [Brevibacillus centrosporus]SFJ66703.1 ribosome biogenesis GTPase [Brevibacillus centrosporus]